MTRPPSSRALTASKRTGSEGERVEMGGDEKRKRSSSSRTLQEKAESLLKIADIVTKTNQERREILDGLPYQNDDDDDDDDDDEEESEVEGHVSGENGVRVISNYPPLMGRSKSCSTVSSGESLPSPTSNKHKVLRSLSTFTEPLKSGTGNAANNNSSKSFVEDSPSVISKTSTRSADSRSTTTTMSSSKPQRASRKELKRQLQDLHKAFATMRENSELKLCKLQLQLDKRTQDLEKRDEKLKLAQQEKEVLQVQTEEYEARFTVCVGTKESAAAFLDMERRNKQLQAQVELLLKEKERLQGIHHQMAATMMGCSKCRKHHQKQTSTNTAAPTLWNSITTSLKDWDPNLTKEAEEPAPSTARPRSPLTEQHSKKIVSPPRAAFQSSPTTVVTSATVSVPPAPAHGTEALSTKSRTSTSTPTTPTGNSRPPLSPAKRSSRRLMASDDASIESSSSNNNNSSSDLAKSYNSRRMNQEPNPSQRAIPKSDTIQDRLLDKNGGNVSSSSLLSNASSTSTTVRRTSHKTKSSSSSTPKSPTGSSSSSSSIRKSRRTKSPKSSRHASSKSRSSRSKKSALPDPTPGALDSFFGNLTKNVNLGEEQMDEERSFFTRRSTRSAPTVSGRMKNINRKQVGAATTPRRSNPRSFTDRWADLETETVASAETDLLDTQSMFAGSYRSNRRSRFAAAAAARPRHSQGVTSVHTGSLEREVAEWRGDSHFTTSLL